MLKSTGMPETSIYSDRKTFAAAILAAGRLAAGFAGCRGEKSRVVARAGSIQITVDDLAGELDNAPAAYQNYLSTVEGKKQFLDILLREKILMNSAERSGIARRNKEIQKNLRDYRKRAREKEIEFRNGLIVREYLRELKDKDLRVTDEEIRKYFDENKDVFERPVKVTASHILSPTQEAAEAVLRRVKKGEDFARVAREISTDPSASRGGMIGEVSKGDLAELPEFEGNLFSLKSGQVSGIVKTKLGYHIIKKTGEIRLPKQSFEQAAPQIHRMIEKRKFDEWIQRTKKEQKVFIDEQVLASVPVPVSEDPSGEELVP